jgi:hypothetical protein
MSKVWPVTALVLLFFAACSKKEDSACGSNETTTFHFSNNKQVDTIWQPSTGSLFANSVAGSDIVFQFRHDKYSCGTASDMGRTDQLIFQIPGGSTSFDHDDSTKLANANTYFTRMCYCPNVTAQHVTGRIKGTRVNSNTWSLEIDVTAPVMGPGQRLTGNFTATLQ